MSKRPSELFRAIDAGRSDLVEKALRRGATVNARAADGSTPLLRACIQGSIELLRLLLDHGADPNLASRRGDHPLSLAAAWNAEAVSLLLARGARAAPDVPRHRSPLFIATRSGSSAIFRLLAEYGAVPRPVYRIALEYGRREIVAQILRLGMRVDESVDGWPPLHLAARQGHPDLVRDLLAQGAEVDRREERRGRTALMETIAYNLECFEQEQVGDPFHAEVVLELLAAGADPRLEDNDGLSALDHAERRGYEPIIDLVESRPPNARANRRTR